MGDLDPRVKARMAKLLELARRGVGGEKENAGRMLERMLAKYGLTIDDLLNDGGEKAWREFRYRNKSEHDLLVQVICAALNTASFKSKQGRNLMLVELTPSEEADIRVRFEAYRGEYAAHLARQAAAARSAFFSVNRIFPEVDNDPAQDAPRMSAEELDDIMAMARRMRPVPVYKRITEA